MNTISIHTQNGTKIGDIDIAALLATILGQTQQPVTVATPEPVAPVQVLVAPKPVKPGTDRARTRMTPRDVTILTNGDISNETASHILGRSKKAVAEWRRQHKDQITNWNPRPNRNVNPWNDAELKLLRDLTNGQQVTFAEAEAIQEFFPGRTTASIQARSRRQKP